MPLKSTFPRFISLSLLVLLLCQLLLPIAPALARRDVGGLDLLPKVAVAPVPSLQDFVASISSDNILHEVSGLSKFSRCLNNSSHAAAAIYLQERIRAVGLVPMVQSFSSSAPGVQVTPLQNIVVRLPGTNPHALHLLTAHYDSSPNRLYPPPCDNAAPGANDNGSGVAVLLELARLFGLGRISFEDDIELVFFDAEEYGYLGSQYFVRNLDSSSTINPANLPLGVVINLDMVGYSAQQGKGKVWAVAQPGASLDLAQQGAEIAATYSPAARYGLYTIGDLFPASRDPNRLSDQSSFWKANKGTAIFLTEDVADDIGNDSRYHTPGDTLYNKDGSLRLDPALMADTARVAIAIAGTKAHPQPRRFFPNLNPLFERNWSRADCPVLVGSETGQTAGRSWLWGLAPNQIFEEPYEEAPGGKRLVTYFDKARMELRLPGSTVTNGLLVRELATGALQLGDTKFSQLAPSQVPVAGDPNQQGQNPTSPTYASFKNLVEGDKVAETHNTPVTATLERNGQAGVNETLAHYARNTVYIPNTGHNIPDLFWTWFESQGRTYDPLKDSYTNGLIFDWQETVGYPISEAYWIRTRIAGQEQEVLVQLFERRVLTYNPANEAAFKVEMGNVGSHYYSWRYNK
ncbi:MAG: Zn-dependent exopeptidase M28 [Chloroflexi bacterium]|nr:Zn-dependent exopeptidase M28 [Chloroflexota bacterium]